MRTPLVVAGLLFALVSTLPAQQESGRYEPSGAWTTPYVEHLIRAGVLREPDPLTRPLRRADLRRALSGVDTAASPSGVRAIVRLLARELEEPVDSVRWRLDAAAGVLAASDARRWAERPAADSAGLFPQAGLAMSLEMPHLTLVTHPAIDNRLQYDPDYRGAKDRAVGGRANEAYAVGSWRYLSVFFGSVGRNLGPTEAEGLALSTSPYSFDHLMVRLGPRRLRLELLAAQLDALPPWDGGTSAVRYFSLHRLVASPTDRLAFSLFETALYTNVNGVERSWEPWALNPLNSFYIAQFTGPEMNANVSVGADVSYDLGRVRAFGQLFVDDLQVDRAGPGDKEPPGYALTLGASGGAGGGTLSWTGLYTRVTNLAYRTPMREEQYTRNGVGLGRNFSDYDQVTARVTGAVVPRALVTGELTVIRQGQGDLRDRYPPVSAFDDSLTFLTGVVERTVRLAAQAVWTPRPDLTLSADLGRHFVTNAGHVAGATGGRWVWRVRAELRRSYGGSVRW